MKWEPVAAMVALLLLGMWVVYGPQIRHELRPDVVTTKFVIGGAKGELEMATDAAGARSFRLLPASGRASRVFTEQEFRSLVGDDIADHALRTLGNTLFRALNVTGYGSLVWVVVGFAGQMLFFGRMLIQWVVSEKRREVAIPESFWWFSLFGGVLLFTYFAWRQDPIGVLGQTSGVVIYARNIRLLHKRRARDARSALAAGPPPEAAASTTGGAAER
ncbi:MAG: lipid-A-disaccharide synthase N-terminal domain-containing protein [Phycisphaerales bacterium]